MRIENEEVKLSPFVDGMAVYVENPKESYQKKKPKVSEFKNVTGYKVNTKRYWTST